MDLLILRSVLIEKILILRPKFSKTDSLIGVPTPSIIMYKIIKIKMISLLYYYELPLSSIVSIYIVLTSNCRQCTILTKSISHGSPYTI